MVALQMHVLVVLDHRFIEELRHYFAIKKHISELFWKQYDRIRQVKGQDF